MTERRYSEEEVAPIFQRAAESAFSRDPATEKGAVI